MINTGPLAARATWEPYPLSVGTALALLGAMGDHPERPMTTKPLLDYDEVWVNLKTLFRNLYQAVDKSLISSVHPAEFAQALQEEMERFRQIVLDLSGGRITTQYYLCDYVGLDRAYPHALLRGDSTELQKRFTRSTIESLGLVLKHNSRDVLVYPLKIEHASRKKILLLTHYAVDLFSTKLTHRALFESHTGAIKEKHEWHTKLLNGQDLKMIPFCESMIQVFGDKEHFRPMSQSIKKAVIATADKYSWSQLTTTLKIRYGFEQLTDPATRTLLLSLL